MSVNPTLTRDPITNELFPLSLPNEIFVLCRDEIKFQATLPAFGTLKSRGIFYLTNQRLVFVTKSDSNRVDFVSFEVPFAEIQEIPKFEQPIFGANYLSIVSRNGGIIFLSFYAGGAGTFLPVFFSLFETARAAEGVSSSPLLRAVAEGRAGSLAFVDPNDPSVFYVTQPRLASRLAE